MRRRSRLLYGSPDTISANSSQVAPTDDDVSQPEISVIDQENDKDDDDDVDIDLISCDVCGKYFVSQESLENHKSQCSGEQPETRNAEENGYEEPHDAAQVENMSVEENIAYYEKQGMTETNIDNNRHDAEIKMTAGSGDEDIKMLQQNYPGLSFIPKFKSEL